MEAEDSENDDESGQINSRAKRRKLNKNKELDSEIN
jgi:hypothetical protein